MITSDHEIGVFVISSTAELPCLNFRIRDLHSVASICATELGSSQTPFFIALGLAPIQPFTAAALSAEGPCACDALINKENLERAVLVRFRIRF